mmetsp:Transcript_94763/g.241021  ORF Transcript_94763/g.241021 Transcript_94763/m.241021 type:complete len:237 (-) Transcript_94763:286-996(-)
MPLAMMGNAGEGPSQADRTHIHNTARVELCVQVTLKCHKLWLHVTSGFLSSGRRLPKLKRQSTASKRCRIESECLDPLRVPRAVGMHRLMLCSLQLHHKLIRVNCELFFMVTFERIFPNTCKASGFTERSFNEVNTGCKYLSNHSFKWSWNFTLPGPAPLPKTINSRPEVFRHATGSASINAFAKSVCPMSKASLIQGTNSVSNKKSLRPEIFATVTAIMATAVPLAKFSKASSET